MDGWMPLDGQTDGWMDGWVNGWTLGQIDGWMDGWMDDGWTDRRIDGYKDTYVYIWLYFKELAKGESLLLDLSEECDDEDQEFEAWEPDPVDADPSLWFQKYFLFL